MSGRFVYTVAAIVLFLTSIGISPVGAEIDCGDDGNNGAGDAVAMVPFQSEWGCVGPSDNFDWYILEIPGYEMQGDVEVTCHEPGLAVRLYERTDTGDVLIEEKSSSAHIRQISFNSTALMSRASTYLLRISFYSANATDHEYHLYAGFYPTSQVTADGNDLPSSASPIAVLEAVDDSLDGMDVRDFFALSGPSGGERAIPILTCYTGSAMLSIYRGQPSPATLIYSQVADPWTDAFSIVDAAMIDAGTIFFAIDHVDNETPFLQYNLSVYPESYIDLSSVVHPPEMIRVPKANVHPNWKKLYPWQGVNSYSYQFSDWPRIGGNPSNNSLTKRVGPMDPILRWQTALSVGGGDLFDFDPWSLLDEKEINIEELLSGKIPYVVPSIQKLLSEPVIDNQHGVLIAGATSEMFDILQQESFSGIDMYDGSVIWTIDGVSSSGQLLLGPSGQAIVPGGGESTVTGSTGIICFSSTLGKELWKVRTPKPVMDMITVDPTRFVASDGDTLRAYSFTDGQVQWSLRFDDYKAPRSFATDNDGNIYGNVAGVLYKISPSGTLLFKREVAPADKGIPINSKTILGANGRVFMSDSRGTVFCVRAKDGSQMWQYPKGSDVVEENLDDNLSHLAELLDLDLSSLDFVDEVQGTIKRPALVIDMACMPNGNIVVLYRKKLYAFNADGLELAHRDLYGPPGGGITTDGAGAIYISLQNSEGVYGLEALDPSLNTIWWMPDSGACSKPSIDSRGYLYVVDAQNNVIQLG